jgi:hypothetical protein
MKEKNEARWKIAQRVGQVLLAAAIFLGAAKLVSNQRIVATMEGNVLHYRGAAYEETGDPVGKLGPCIGKVRFEDGDTAKLYSVEGKSGPALHVSFGWDGRNYVPVAAP